MGSVWLRPIGQIGATDKPRGMDGRHIRPVCYNGEMIRGLGLLVPIVAAMLLAAAPAYAEQPGDSAAAKANHCVGCHNIPGYRSVFPSVYPVPKIIGQSALYIDHALRAYRGGERKHPSMNGIAAQLSDADIKVLAEFYAGGGQ